MKRILQAQKFLNLENYILNYYITLQNSNDKNIYGIEIEKCKNISGKNEILEIENISNITYNYEQINNIINILINNYVTPITLIYILDDIIENIDLE